LNLFELTLRIKGFPILEAKKQLQKIQQIPEVKYESYIESRRAEIVDYHFQENSFYQNFVGDKSISNWNSIPIMQKSDLQRPLGERLSRGFSEKNVYINKTSGSSGHPFVFAKDKFSHALTWAEIMDRYHWHGIDFNASLEARFYGIPLDKTGYRKERFKDRLSHRYRFPIFDLSDKKMEEFLKVFKRKKFDYINGYTSSVVLFAKFLMKQGLHLNEVCPTIKHCIVTSEMLFESDKELLKEAFGVPVINEYGASELDLIAFTNSVGRFVVNSETLFVEIIDEHDQPVIKGLPGRIVITSLYNKAHPMIRYDIGDTGILDPRSTVKTPILQELVGRTNDIAKLPNGKTVPGLTFYYVTKSVIEDDGNVKEFIIEQTTLDTFKIVYVSEKQLTNEEINVIKSALFKYLENNLTLVFERVTVLDRSRRGKLKQFISLLS
jgi:phenylacetate-CoA ligase